MSTRLAAKGIALTAVAGLLLAALTAVPVAAKPSDAEVDKVRQGMTRAEVVDLLGRPDRDQEVKDADGLCRLYAYKKVGRYRLVNIWFDCDDRVKEIDKIT
ncbi:MAG: outer membrane protein assembly factor BamE domain-containing protein [Candidatus Acidiferrales bacterium]